MKWVPRLKTYKYPTYEVYLLLSTPDFLGSGRDPADNIDIISNKKYAPLPTRMPAPITRQRSEGEEPETPSSQSNCLSSGVQHGTECPHNTGNEEMIDITTGSEPSLPASPKEELPKGIYTILSVFVLLKILLSYDSGAFSSSLALDGGIADDLNLTAGQQGSLSSSVFLGNMVGCAIAGQMFTYYSAQRLLVLSVISHGVFTFLFAASSNYVASLIIRFCIGITIAFIVVYTPIWVEEFAPKSRSTTWMALCNVGVPLGIMVGFMAGGLIPVYTNLSWRSSFYIKCVVLIPFALFTANADRSLLDSKERAIQSGGLASGPLNTSASTQAAMFLNGLKKYMLDLTTTSFQLCQTPIYILNVLGLSMMYFVVTALQNFVTPYLRNEPFNASMDTIVVGFGLSVVSAPVVGVIVGGLIMDRIGGYHGNMFVASAFSLACGMFASLVGILCMAAETTASFLVPMWVVLCFGGAIVPVAVGLTMASVPSTMRPYASSFSNIVYNMLGFFLGPFVCGYVIELTNLQWGIRSTLGVAWIGMGFMIMALLAARRHEANEKRCRSAAAESTGTTPVSHASVPIANSRSTA